MNEELNIGTITFKYLNLSLVATIESFAIKFQNPNFDKVITVSIFYNYRTVLEHHKSMLDSQHLFGRCGKAYEYPGNLFFI